MAVEARREERRSEATMIFDRPRFLVAATLVLWMLLSQCGGGGGGGVSVRGKTVYWSPPQTFTDNTPLVPATDLDRYEIYVKQEPSFAPTDNHAVAPRSAESYYLGNWDPPLAAGVTYFVSIRAVTTWGTESDFSAAVPFSVSR